MLTPDQVRLRLEMARYEYTRGSSNDALHHVLTLLEEVLPSLVAPPTQSQRPESHCVADAPCHRSETPMTDERLAKIETDHAEHCPILHIATGDAYLRQVDRAIRADDVNGDHCDLVELLAEVRRLKRDNLLLSLSRGTPSVVGIEVR